MKLGMVFPGYADQFVGMGKELYDESRIMQEYFDEASHCLDTNFLKLCFASSDSEISKMQYAHTALFLVSSSIHAHLAELGIVPHVVAGFDIGQYTAFHAVKGLTFPDGLYLLTKLTQFLQELYTEHPIALMRIKGCSATALEELMREHAVESMHIAYYESVDQLVISGLQTHIEEFMRVVEQAHPKAKVNCAPIELGLHSVVAQPAIKQFEIYLEKVDFKDTLVPVIANSSAQLINTGAELRKEVIQAQLHPVQWYKTMLQLHDCDLILTIGPAKTLTSMLKKIYPEKQIYTILKPTDIDQLRELLQLPSNPEQYHDNNSEA
jgi:[acyl-carrier-protein] S-malonyltransferase